MAACYRCWDCTAQRGTEQLRERTIATSNISRSDVRLSFKESPVLAAGYPVMLLPNANGADLYIYPGFVVAYDGSDQSFALLALQDVQLTYAASRFIEEEEVPSDSEVIEHTWRYTNKNGSMDLRYNDNYRIPIVAYGKIRFESDRYATRSPCGCGPLS